jgi:hypothetical protein
VIRRVIYTHMDMGIWVNLYPSVYMDDPTKLFFVVGMCMDSNTL